MSISESIYIKYKNSKHLLNSEQEKALKDYEAKGRKQSKSMKEYSKRVFKDLIDDEFVVNPNVLMRKFMLKYKELEGVDYDLGYIENLNPLIYYFSKDKRFFECNNLSRLSKPSFDKGILIVGNYGNGKSSTMNTFHKLFNHTPLVFKSFTANRIVTMFEEIQEGSERYAFMNRTKTKSVYFDDVKTEKEASNYGKHNLMKDILEERSQIKDKTYITCNYVEGDDSENLVDALHEFNTRYGARVYDRLFSMFNILEFKGKSKRV